MKIAICHTKQSENANQVYEAFDKGVSRHGDTAVHIEFGNISAMDGCDVFFMVSYPNVVCEDYIFCDDFPEYIPEKQPSNHMNNFRLEVWKKAKEQNKRMIVLDTGVIGYNRNIGRNSQDYYQLSFDCIKNLGRYYTENSPPDRFNRFRRPIMPWQKFNNEGNVLLIGQVRYGIASQHIDIQKWYRIVYETVMNTANPPFRGRIGFRNHPNGQPIKDILNKCSKLKELQPRSYRHDLLSSTCTITFSSQAAIESVIMGVPVVACSKVCLGYEFMGIGLAKFQRPAEFPREQWLYNLAYTQYNVEEMAEGLAWDMLRPHVFKIEDRNPLVYAKRNSEKTDNLLSQLPLPPVS